MAKIKNWWTAHKPTRRRLIQLYAALLYNAHAKGFIEGSIYTGPLKKLCVPGLNCYSCPGAVGACPLGALQNALTSAGTRAPHYVLGILLLFGLVLGRTICGWLCPAGLIQELLHKLPTPKMRKNRLTRILSLLKYAILGIFVVLLPLVYGLRRLPLPAFCKYICPAGTLEGALGLLSHPANADKFSMLGLLFTRKFLILVAVLLACVFIYRAFCRFLCPLGAIYSLFSRISLLGIKVVPGKCVGCGGCLQRCPMDIRRVGDRECIHCGACMDVCPTGAIRWKGRAYASVNPEEKVPSRPRSRRLRAAVAWTLAIALLMGIAVHANRSSTGPTVVEAALPAADTLPIGPEPGMQGPDFTASLYSPGAGDFKLSDQRGKVVVLNFWATWCGPCCAELPHFQTIADRYPDDLCVIALHSHLVTEDVQAFLDAQGYSFSFALDPDGSIIQSYGGSTMLPMTVILDRSGKIVYNQEGSMTEALLEQLISPLL